jgi:dihydroorotase
VDPSDLVNPDVLDADGLIALPGLVDLHTHLRQPGNEAAETIASGTAAAARGGYTAVFAMANTDPVCDSAEAVRRLRALVGGDKESLGDSCRHSARSRRIHLTDVDNNQWFYAKSADPSTPSQSAEVLPVGAITVGLEGSQVADMEGMHAAGVTYFSDDGKCVMNASIMREALIRARALSAVVAQHSQDSHLAGGFACLPSPRACLDAHSPGPEDWPTVAESVIVARDVQLAIDTGAHLHVCHVSTAESVEIIAWAKARGVRVTAEVTGHHLLLGSALLDTRDTTYKVNPPLRDAENVEAVRAGLASGIIDAVATDHAPHTPADKAKDFPLAKPGMLGLETVLGVVIEVMVSTGRLDWASVADRMSHTPARIGGVAERHGRPLRVGEPANFVLLDPTRRTVIDRDTSSSRSRNNPYHGLDLPDPVVGTWWNGRRTFG